MTLIKQDRVRLLQLLACLILVFAMMGCNSEQYSERPFALYQNIPTSHASCWHSFTMAGQTYLAVANYDVGVDLKSLSGSQQRPVYCKVYQWNSKEFQEIQAIPSNGATCLRSFTINQETYLAVAYPGGSHIKIYRWQGKEFVEAWVLPARSPRDIISFTIDGQLYLGVTNHYNAAEKSYLTDSMIYRWSGASFEEFQAIPTAGAMRWNKFIIKGTPYLAIANNFDGSSHNINSAIYKWEANRFVLIQSIPSSAATSCESFAINGETYLAVANNYNNKTHNINSTIWKWNGASFEQFQSIPTIGGVYWKSFVINGETYLAIANHYDSSRSSYNTNSRLYRWNGKSFQQIQIFPTHCACFWENMVIDGTDYLVVANAFDGKTYDLMSVVYKYVK